MAVASLTLLLALQIALPSRTELPPDSGLAPRHARAQAVPAIGTYPALAQRNVFSPDGDAAGTGAAVNAPLDDRQAVGVIMTGRTVAALVKAPGSSAQLLHAGQSVEGWRLARIERDALTFERGAERRRMIVGAPPRTAPSQAQIAAPAPQGAETSQ